MHYTLHQLQIFMKIAEKGSITKAADELHLTQPAVSIQLKKFQEQFDVPLIDIIGKKLYVTDFGNEIIQSASKILAEVDSIKHRTLAFKGELAGKLSISVASTGKYVMPYLLEGFLSAHPGVDLEMDVTNKTKVVESLERNEVDFALVSVLPDHMNIEAEELMENELVLVSNKARKGKRKLDVTSLKESTLILREEGSATRKASERFIKEWNLPIKKTIQLTSNEAVKQAVLAGLGYSIMPRIGIRGELSRKSLHIIPLKGLPIFSNWNLIWQKEKQLSPIASKYLEFLRENKAELIERFQ